MFDIATNYVSAREAPSYDLKVSRTTDNPYMQFEC